MTPVEVESSRSTRSVLQARYLNSVPASLIIATGTGMNPNDLFNAIIGEDRLSLKWHANVEARHVYLPNM
jgi:hypothetical protein